MQSLAGLGEGILTGQKILDNIERQRLARLQEQGADTGYDALRYQALVQRIGEVSGLTGLPAGGTTGAAAPATGGVGPPTQLLPPQLQGLGQTSGAAGRPANAAAPQDESSLLTPQVSGGANYAGLRPEYRQAMSRFLTDMPADLRGGLGVSGPAAGARTLPQQAEIRQRHERMPGGVAAHPAAEATPEAPHVSGRATDVTFTNPRTEEYTRKVLQKGNSYGLEFSVPNDPNHLQLAARLMKLGDAMGATGEMPQVMAQVSTQTAFKAGQTIDPRQWGYVGLPDMVKAIEAVSDKDTPNIVKSFALAQMNQLLAPADKQAVQSAFKQNEQALKAEIAEAQRNEKIWQVMYQTAAAGGRQDKAIAAADARAEDMPIGPPVQTESGGWVQPLRGGRTRPLPGTPLGAVTAQTRVEADPAKSAFDAYKKEYRDTHEGKDPPADEQAAFRRKLYPPRSGPGIALTTFIDEFTQREGHPPGSADIRQFQAETRAMTSEAGTLGTTGANVEIQAAKAEALLPLVKELSSKISRTSYPDINSLILAYETKTGDPTVVQYGEVVNALRYTFAGVMARGGQARVADLAHFDEIFNKAWTTGQVDAAIEQIQTTINREREAILKTRQQVGKPPGQREGAPGQTAPGAGRSNISTMSGPELKKYYDSLTPDQRTPEILKQIEARAAELERRLR